MRRLGITIGGRTEVGGQSVAGPAEGGTIGVTVVRSSVSFHRARGHYGGHADPPTDRLTNRISPSAHHPRQRGLQLTPHPTPPHGPYATR